jgi:hypothetical protein
MKKFITSLVAALGLVLALAAPVTAAHSWQIKMSDPKATSQTRTFNIEFVTLSAEADDDITVTLRENGVDKVSKTTTKDFGDSGTFTVTVPTDGTYTYSLHASSSVDSGTKDTPNRQVTVTTPAEGSSSVVVVSDQSTAASSGSTGNNGVGGFGGGAGDQQVAGSSTGSNSQTGSGTNNGKVDDKAASTTNEQNGVLGAETTAKKPAKRWPYIVGAIVIALACAGYYLFRTGRLLPFGNRDS